MRKLPITACLLTAGCASMTVTTTPYPVTPAIEMAVKSAVAGVLKDPQSAQFGSMAGLRSDKTGDVRVCGTVNAKNGFGGYTGATRFAVLISDAGGAPTVKDTKVAKHDSGDQFALGLMCGNAGT